MPDVLAVAAALGDQEEAARLHENVRPLEMLVPYTLGSDGLLDHQKVVAELDATVPESRQRELHAEVAALSVEQTNRWAQEVARRLAGHRPPQQTEAPRLLPALTPREHEVLAALASGRTNREIADVLGMSAKTVMHHSVAIYRKLGVQGRAGATAWAYQHGMTVQLDACERRSAITTCTGSPSALPMAVRPAALTGSLWVPSPMAMNDESKGWPSTVPRTFTRPRVPKNSTERGHTT